MSDAVGANTAGAPSGGGASQSGQQAPASNAADRGDKKERVARARADAARQHGNTRAPKAFDPKVEARKAMAERKNVHLAAKNGERVARAADEREEPAHQSDLGEDDADHAVISPDSGDDAEESPGSESEQEPEKAPTWAKKLRDENESFKQREQRWNDSIGKIEASLQAKDTTLQERAWEIEDLKETIKLHDNVRAQLIKFLNTVAPGKFVPESLDKLLLLHEKRGLERRLQRGQQTAQQQRDAQMRQGVHGQVRQQMEGLRKQYPELDWEKSADAKAFLTRYAQRNIPISEITPEEIQQFVAAQRFLATQRRTTGAQGEQRPTDVPDRPTESLRHGAAGARRRTNEPVSLNSNLSNGAARKLVRDFRAAKAARQ